MDQVIQQRIFDPFFTTKESGSGLGLAALLGTVRSHHGALSLASRVGTGSCFTIYLPPEDHISETLAPAQQADESDQIKINGTVLIVDDEEPVRDVASRIFERQGIKVITAIDGEQGVASLQTHQHEISLVLLDMTMPRMDGEQAFHAMREIVPDLPVLLSSGFELEADQADQLYSHGLAGFIRKPYTRTNLLQAAQQAIAKGEASA